ncbi:MAG TPA: GNAT family N-acetyltransferase [Bacilli bacterium]|nr:GNAT family N-acetyltransferase [Bacilli bacterium]
MITFQYYEDRYFYDIEKMVIHSYTYDIPIWGLSRHEFTKAIHPDFKSCHQAWNESMGLSFEDNHLVAAVLSEGTYDGDAFLIFDSKERTNDLELIKRMVKFAITHLSSIDEDRVTRTLNIQIPNWNTSLIDVVMSFGFVKTEYSENINILPFDEKQFEVALPNGFRFNKQPVPAFYLSNVHRMSFNYGFPYAENGSKAFHALRQMKHYDPSLEVVILDEENQPVAFAIGWMDPSLPYAELEPMAVCWWHRRKGLGKALLHELANRIKAKYPHASGMTGGDQPFYTSIGFQTVATLPTYQYKRTIHRSWDPKSKDERYDI